MNYIKTSLIKPDPNQPRRTFKPEKMMALEASMRKDGYRTAYPLLIDENNVLIDGECRWRAAKKAGIDKVPVEIKANVKPAQRLIYQLQSEGAELATPDKYEAYAKLWKLLEPTGVTQRAVGKELLGDDFQSFVNMVGIYENAELAKKALSKETVQKNRQFFSENIHTPAILGREKDPQLRKSLVEKAVKESWNEEKASTIREAIKEAKHNDYRINKILSQDYSDPYPNSNQWKLRLEVAKSDVDINEVRELDNTRKSMQSQIEAYDRIIEYGLKMAAAMREFDYTQVTPQTRVKLHQNLIKFIPFATTYLAELEEYMLGKGELDKGTKKLSGKE